MFTTLVDFVDSGIIEFVRGQDGNAGLMDVLNFVVQIEIHGYSKAIEIGWYWSFNKCCFEQPRRKFRYQLFLIDCHFCLVTQNHVS